MARKITEQELEVLESGVEGHPMSRVQVLESELKELENEKKINEIEKGLHHLMEEIHPSKRAQATKALKQVLGGVKENLKGRHIGNVERREKFKKGIGEIVKFLKESKARREGTSAGTSEFRVPTKYYENVLGRGWISPEKEEMTHKKHHHKHPKAIHHKKHRRYMPYSTFEKMPERAMYYSRARRRMPWEEY